MPREFQCPECGADILTFIRVGDLARCKGCGGECAVPDDATEKPGQLDPERSADPGEPFEVGGRRLECQFCGHDRFRRKEILMNTEWLTFFGVEYWDRSADTYVCRGCGYVMWFMPVE